MGFKGKIEPYKVAQPLHGYLGDEREQKAPIIIRRHNVGHFTLAWGDLGWCTS